MTSIEQRTDSKNKLCPTFIMKNEKYTENIDGFQRCLKATNKTRLRYVKPIMVMAHAQFRYNPVMTAAWAQILKLVIWVTETSCLSYSTETSESRAAQQMWLLLHPSLISYTCSYHLASVLWQTDGRICVFIITRVIKPMQSAYATGVKLPSRCVQVKQVVES